MPSLRICPVSLIFALAAVLGILVLAGSAHAQALEPVDRPTPYVSQRLPTQRERDRVDSLKLYVLGLLCENEDRLLEALQAFQDAVKLDPDAAAVYKAQVPILITLDRRAEALAATGKVIELDPSDYETWYIRARLLKIDGKLPAARAALLKGLATVVFKAHPENAHQMYFELGSILEIEGSFKQAADAFLESCASLNIPTTCSTSALPRSRSALASRKFTNGSADYWSRSASSTRPSLPTRRPRPKLPAGSISTSPRYTLNRASSSRR